MLLSVNTNLCFTTYSKGPILTTTDQICLRDYNYTSPVYISNFPRISCTVCKPQDSADPSIHNLTAPMIKNMGQMPLPCLLLLSHHYWCIWTEATTKKQAYRKAREYFRLSGDLSTNHRLQLSSYPSVGVDSLQMWYVSPPQVAMTRRHILYFSGSWNVLKVAGWSCNTNSDILTWTVKNNLFFFWLLSKTITMCNIKPDSQ